MNLLDETLAFHVLAAEQDERLDRFLASHAPALSRSRLKQLVQQGRASVDGLPAKPGQRLKAGQKVILAVPAPTMTELVPDPSVSFGVLYQDPEMIVINKPPGLVVHLSLIHI